MSLSISNSNLRAPRLNYIISLIGTFVVFLFLCACLIIANAYIDPFHFGSWGPKAKIERTKAFRRKNTALWHAAGVERILHEIPESKDAEVLIVGDSRARAMTGSWALDSNIFVVDSKGRKIFNLAYGGAGLSESIDMYNHYKDKFPHAKTVVFSVDFEKISNIYPPGSVREQLDEALRTASNPIIYYLNFRTLKYYLESFLAGEISSPRDYNSEKIKLTTLDTPERFTIQNKYTDAQSLDTIFKRDGWLRMARYMEARINGTSKEALEKTLETQLIPMIEHSRSIDFVFVALPIHPHFEKLINRKKRKIYHEMMDRLAVLGSVYDALLYDGGNTLFEVQDPLHVIDAATSILQDALDCHEAPVNYESVIAYSEYSPCFNNLDVEKTTKTF